jgi:predicted lipid-binding transport protein (Tim44 family)
MLMFGLLAAAVMVAIGFFMRKRALAKQSTAAAPGSFQYAHANADTAPDTSRPEQQAPAYKVAMPAVGHSAIRSGIGSGMGAGVASAKPIPSNIDVAGFERNAKVNFIRLQAANDACNLDDIRQFTTPEMFAELKLEMRDRGSAAQKNDVVNLNAQVVEVDENADRYLVSVRINGFIRDDSAASEEAFDERWHLMKARQGSGGWVLAGIQQTQ